jgi:hypothetical protein
MGYYDTAYWSSYNLLRSLKAKLGKETKTGESLTIHFGAQIITTIQRCTSFINWFLTLKMLKIKTA